jgi:hypothetical protein
MMIYRGICYPLLQWRAADYAERKIFWEPQLVADPDPLSQSARRPLINGTKYFPPFAGRKLGQIVFEVSSVPGSARPSGWNARSARFPEPERTD